MIEKQKVRVTVNGTVYEREVDPRFMLGDFLREDLGLTGTHYGCEHGVCGACTIIYNGDSVRSCLMLAVQANGAEIETVEGLGDAQHLHPLQQAFWDHHALQCGFCTPGMLMSIKDMIKKYALETDEEIRIQLSGNLCRCTGYQNIVTAIRAVVADKEATKEMRK